MPAFAGMTGFLLPGTQSQKVFLLLFLQKKTILT